MPETEFQLRRFLTIAAILLSLLVGIYATLSHFGALEILGNRETFQAWVDELGAYGPLAVIGAMTTAIVFTPVPSAPIALVAGAVYGHGWGTLYILLGSALGASSAFLIARLFGFAILRRWFGEKLSLGLLGSQNVLMGVVFASRLLPFLSFDIVSYAAGLTSLTFWRFAIATLAGIAPASFLLAHFGSELATGDAMRIAGTVVALGALTLIPVIIGLRRRRAANSSSPIPNQPKTNVSKIRKSV